MRIALFKMFANIVIKRAFAFVCLRLWQSISYMYEIFVIFNITGLGKFKFAKALY